MVTLSIGLFFKFIRIDCAGFTDCIPLMAILATSSSGAIYITY